MDHRHVPWHHTVHASVHCVIQLQHKYTLEPKRAQAHAAAPASVVPIQARQKHPGRTGDRPGVRPDRILPEHKNTLQLSSELHTAAEHKLRRPGHVDVVITLPPLNLQRPTREVHPAVAINLPLKHTSHHSRACTGATGQSAPSPTLPHHHADMRPAENLHKLCVCLRRKDCVLLTLGAQAKEVQLINLQEKGYEEHTYET